jgi:spore germination protein KA
MKVETNLKENIENIQGLFGDSLDLNIRRISIGEEGIDAALVFMAGLSDTQVIEEIIEALQIKLLSFQETNKNDLSDNITKRALNNKDVVLTEKMARVLKDITIGSAAILIDGINQIILCESKGFEIRSIREPDNEKTIRGPRDGFVENIFTNTSLLRQRIRVPHLWIQGCEKGSLSKVNVAITYIKGLASGELVEEVKSRISKIDIDAVLESGYIEEYIVDEKYSLFPLVKRTERPDKVVSCLLEGKIAIFTEGTPFCIIVPVSFSLFLQSPDDYYELFPRGSFIRILRYTSFIISIFLPGIYVAILNYHFELLPVKLLLRIASTREGIPFPVIIEALLMAFLFEVLREAGVRLPKAIGPAK